jgi:sulfide:quinone oxidoreductase
VVMSERVLIAGSGVAGVEAVLALRQIAGRAVAIDLLAPSHALVDRPASVAAPFGLGAPPPLDLRELADRFAVTLVEGGLGGVDVATRSARLSDGRVHGYDYLLVAVGARLVPAVPGALTFRGPRDVPMLEWLLGDLVRRARRNLAIVVPPGATWPLPAYELAVMAAGELRMHTAATSVTLVTAEREPLWVFGPQAGTAIKELLAQRKVGLKTGAPAHRFEPKEQALRLTTGEALEFDAVVSLPTAVGPGVAGLPADDLGFLPTDAHGYVATADRVLAAGDATTFPIKQGGLATQQADAAAATIAAALNPNVVPEPFAPVLRGLLLTGGAPLYLRATLDPRGGVRQATARALRGEVSSRALWWPPGKVAGRYLAPYLATARPVALNDEPLVDRVATTHRQDHEAALDLALLLADEDAAAGDLTLALHALDAAAALSGGVLPAPYAERRELWRAAD